MKIFNAKRNKLAMVLVALLGLLMINACGKKDNINKSTVGTTVAIEESTITESVDDEANTDDTTLATEEKLEEIVTSSDATTEQDETTASKVEETTPKQTISTQTTEYKENAEISMKDREKTESPYYYKRSIVKLVYKDNGSLDIKNTVLGVEFDDDKTENMLLVYDIQELTDIVKRYSNTYNPVIGICDLKEASYAVTYPYYDIRDYSFWSYTYNKDGTVKAFIEFYFDKNYQVIYGKHPWWEYKMGGTAFPNYDVSPDEVTDNNPYYYKKDIINFVYNMDGSSNIYETILGSDLEKMCWNDVEIWEDFTNFFSKVKEIKEVEANALGLRNTSVSRKTTFYYDIRDYKWEITDTYGTRCFGWDEKYNFIEE